MSRLSRLEQIARRFSAGVASSATLPVDGVSEPKLHPFDERNIHPELATVARKLFDNGHYPQATFEAFKYLDKQVAKLSRLKESGYSLMMNAFSDKNPKIQLTTLAGTSEIDEQRGFQFIFAGSATAIRNPRGHEVALPDTLDECLDHLSLASFLLRRLDKRLAPAP